MGEDGDFSITATDRAGRPHDYRTRKVIVSTGYYDLANQLCIPGEDLPKVSHYYGDAHPYYDTDVLVIGGKNSAAIAALDLWRHGARVTLVYRGSQLHHHVKYWIKPDLENRIKAGEIEATSTATVQEIGIDYVVIVTPRGPIRLKNDFVLALIGYHPDYDFLRSMGIELSDEQCRPVCDPVSLESNVPGIYVAGVIVAGSRTNEIFIENGRFHGKQIAADLKLNCDPNPESLLENPVDLCRHDEVTLGEAVDLLRSHCDFGFAPLQQNVGMVALFLRQRSHSIHKIECPRSRER